jgi:hypothetical protein
MISLWCGWSLASGSYTQYVRLLPRHEFGSRVFYHLLPGDQARLSEGVATLTRLASQLEDALVA